MKQLLIIVTFLFSQYSQAYNCDLLEFEKNITVKTEECDKLSKTESKACKKELKKIKKQFKTCQKQTAEIEKLEKTLCPENKMDLIREIKNNGWSKQLAKQFKKIAKQDTWWKNKTGGKCPSKVEINSELYNSGALGCYVAQLEYFRTFNKQRFSVNTCTHKSDELKTKCNLADKRAYEELKKILIKMNEIDQKKGFPASSPAAKSTHKEIDQFDFAPEHLKKYDQLIVEKCK
jgi:hypothetical protein